MIEKRAQLQADKIFRYEKNNKFYQLSCFFEKDYKKGVFVFLHETDKNQSINLKSKKLLKTFFNDKTSYVDFLESIENYFLNFKNLRQILLDIEKKDYDDIWINPNYIFKNNNNNKNNLKNNSNSKDGYVDVSNISIYSLLEENSSGNSILSDLGLISNFSSFNPSGDEIKVKMNILSNNKLIHFSLSPNMNFFSDWTKGVNSFSGYGAVSFFTKAFGMTKKEAQSTLFKVYLKNKHKDILKKVDFFKFKNSFTMPLSNNNKEKNDQVVQYISQNRSISPEIVNYMLQNNVISYSNMIRTPIDTRVKSKKNISGKEVDLNKTKQGIFSDLFYFNLYDNNDNIQSIQHISLDPRFKKKLNAGSTTGVYSGLKNPSSKKYVISESAFDNISLYEIAKRKKINTDLYNFLSCQSVGGVLTWLESNFNVSFDKKEDNLKIFKNEEKIDISDFNESFIESFKKEIFGDKNKKDKIRKFVFIYNNEDDTNKEKFKIIASSLKKISKDISIEWIESKNRYYKFFDYLPLDIVIDSSSVDNWLSRNEFTIENGYLQNKKILKTQLEIDNNEIIKFKNKYDIEAIISACDNDNAGIEVSEKIKLFCETFGIKYADWSPDLPFIKDHNDSLRLYKGKDITYENQNGESLIYNLNNVDKNEIFKYVDESKINFISNKKKITNKIF